MAVRILNHPNHRLVLFAALPASVGLFVAALTIQGFSGPENPPLPPPLKSARSPLPGFAIEISPDPISLGTVSPGGSASAMVAVHNPGAGPVTVLRIEISCPCLRAEPAAMTLEPGETSTLLLTFDSNDDPDFRGGLSIEVSGSGPTGERVFRTRVNVEVGAEARAEGPGPAHEVRTAYFDRPGLGHGHLDP